MATSQDSIQTRRLWCPFRFISEQVSTKDGRSSNITNLPLLNVMNIMSNLDGRKQTPNTNRYKTENETGSYAAEASVDQTAEAAEYMRKGLYITQVVL